ncbi:MAG: hypothetical protein ACRDZ3_17405, partial [Acidimicrobiia bacterium]
VADSATLSSSILARGRLFDAGGRPAAGVVRLYSWPRWTGTETTPVELPLVAWTVTGPDGVFALRASRDPGAGAADRSRNLVLLADSGGSRYETHFARRVAPLAWETGDSRPADALEVRLDPASEHVDRVDGRYASGEPLISRCHRRQLDEYPYVHTTVGEINTSDGVRRGSFAYEQREDSHVSVAVEIAGGGWGARGEHHLDNSTGAKTTFNINGGGNYRVESPFTYVRYNVTCNGEDFNSHEEIVAERWEGGGRQIAHNVPGCAGSPNARDYPAGAKVERDEREAYTWGGAASVGGASFKAHSGFSKFLRNVWEFDRSKPIHWLCGDDDVPSWSKRIFSGLETPYPVDDCRPGRPC